VPTERKIPESEPVTPDFDFDAVDFDAAQPSIDAALKSYASWIAATQPAVTALHATAVAVAATGSTSLNSDTYDDDMDDSYAFIPTTWGLPARNSAHDTAFISPDYSPHTFAIQCNDSVQYSETSKVGNNVLCQAGGLEPTRVLERSSLLL
jgi:hypothetical protein